MNLTLNSDPLFSEKPLASDVIHLAGAGEREHLEVTVLEAGDLGPGNSGSAEEGDLGPWSPGQPSAHPPPAEYVFQHWKEDTFFAY